MKLYQYSATSSARQARPQQLIAWFAFARGYYEASYDACKASPDAGSDRRRIRALMALAAAREAYCHAHQPS